jgi:hypothetical protein
LALINLTPNKSLKKYLADRETLVDRYAKEKAQNSAKLPGIYLVGAGLSKNSAQAVITK